MEEQFKVEMMAVDNNGAAHFKGFRFGDNRSANLKIFFPESLKIYYSCLWANWKNNSCSLLFRQLIATSVSLSYTYTFIVNRDSLLFAYYIKSNGEFLLCFLPSDLWSDLRTFSLESSLTVSGASLLPLDISLYREIVEGFWCSDKSVIHDQHFYQNCQSRQLFLLTFFHLLWGIIRGKRRKR